MIRIALLIVFSLMVVMDFMRSITPYEVYVRRKHDIALEQLKNHTARSPGEQRFAGTVHLACYVFLTLLWVFAFYAVWFDVWP